MNTKPFPNPVTNGKELVVYVKNKDYFKVVRSSAGSIFKKNSIHKKNSFLYKELMRPKTYKIWGKDLKKKASLNERKSELEKILLNIYLEGFDPKHLDGGAGPNLLFGDSQIAGSLGNALSSKFGISGGGRQGVSGSTACKWKGALFSKIKDQLEAKPQKIIIGLGGNGPGCVSELLDKMYEISPESKVIFFTNGPVAEFDSIDLDKYERNFGRELSDELYKSYVKNRPIYKESVKKQAESSKYYKDGNLQVVDLFGILGSTYTCKEKCDGIHLTKVEAEKIASAV